MTPLTFLLLALATWRVAHLLAYEEGPAHLFERLRVWVGVRYDAQSQPYPATNLAEGLTCLWCNSVWVGALWGWLALALPGPALWLALPFALSALAILVEEVQSGNR